MTWTKDKPTVEGWYWYKDEENEQQIVRIDKNVYCGPYEPALLGSICGDNRGMDLDRMNGLWYGPIEPPCLSITDWRLNDVPITDINDAWVIALENLNRQRGIYGDNSISVDLLFPSGLYVEPWHKGKVSVSAA